MLLLFSSALFAQVSISTDNSAPDNSAMLDVKSTSKGLLPPRVTLTERNAIGSPANGLMVFCTNCGTNGSLSIYSNGAWRTFVPCNISTPLAGTNVVTPNQIIWYWNTVPDATGYKWNTSATYEAATDMGTSTSKTETGIACNTVYSRYIWAYSTCGVSASTTLTETTASAGPTPPVSGTHIPSGTQIVWNWNTVPGATGYKWSATDNSASATDMGASTTKTETGLTPNSPYIRFVWAYNACGISTSTTLNCTTLLHYIGESFGGGIIFYIIDGSPQTGLISATSDQSTGAPWGCDGTSITTFMNIGSGLANTNAIVSGCSTPGIAARICDTLTLNGHTDWFLPSKDEINQMYIQKDVIGGFGENSFWCSSQNDSESWTAWYDGFAHGGQGWTNKSTPNHVRAVRAF